MYVVLLKEKYSALYGVPSHFETNLMYSVLYCTWSLSCY